MTGDSFPRIARAASAFVTLLGAIVLCGWFVDSTTAKSISPGFASMKANTATCLVLAGVSLWVQIDGRPASWRASVARLSALVVAVVGLLTLTEYVFGAELGLDQLLIQSAAVEPGTSNPGRMGPNTALSFLLAGIVLGQLDTDRRPIRRLLQPFTIAVFAIAFLAICGYSLGPNALHGVARYSTMAVHTAAGLAVLSTGILFARPQRGIVAVIAQDNAAGAAIRRVLPLILVVQLILGWIRLGGQRAGFYSSDFGLELTITASTAVFATLVLWNAKVQGALEGAQRQSLRDQTFLFELSDLLRTSPRSSNILIEVSTRLGTYLGASRCLFNEIDVDGDRSIVRSDYARGLRSLAGTQPLSAFSAESRDEAMAGHTVVNNDTSTDPRSAPRYEEAYRPGSLRALVAVPLLRNARWVATLLVSSDQPRVWQEREVRVIQSVAESTWLWFEHLVALDALRQSEQNLAVTNSGLELRVEERTAALRASLKEREVLLQEVHHRVKNNLQVVSSLINMQMRQLSDAPARLALDECRSRVQAIALIHEKLYQSKDYANVPLSEYVKGLAANIFHATGVSHGTIAFEIDVDASLSLAMDRAIPCGLILNELITNALKHAFPADRRGKIRVELGRLDAHMLLVVRDDGVGMPPEFDPARSTSLGMQLVVTLVEQLDGRLEIVRDAGTAFRITFPIADA